MTDSTQTHPVSAASRPQGFLVAAFSRLRAGLVDILTDDRPAYAWRQGPDHLYQATRSAFGKPR